MGKKVQMALMNHHIIRLSFGQILKIFCLNVAESVLPCFQACCLNNSRNNRRLWTLFDEGRKRMQMRFDLF